LMMRTKNKLHIFEKKNKPLPLIGKVFSI